MRKEPGPDRNAAVREGGVGDADTDLGVWENFKKVFDCRIVLLTHGGHEHFMRWWGVRRLGLGACGIGNIWVGRRDIQAMEEGMKSGDVVS